MYIILIVLPGQKYLAMQKKAYDISVAIKNCKIQI